jgi:hypothetical protein
VPGDDVADDPRLARLVVADDVRRAEPVERGREVERGETDEKRTLSA